jgi:hypothetical protein
VTQAISERPHHVRGKVRRLLNEKMEPSPVDFSQATRRLRNNGSGTVVVVNQCHFPNERTLLYRFEYEIAKQDLHFSLQQHEHVLALVTFPEKEIARRELYRITILTKKVCWIHEGQSLQKRADICQVTIV